MRKNTLIYTKKTAYKRPRTRHFCTSIRISKIHFRKFTFLKNDPKFTHYYFFFRNFCFKSRGDFFIWPHVLAIYCLHIFIRYILSCSLVYMRSLVLLSSLVLMFWWRHGWPGLGWAGAGVGWGGLCWLTWLVLKSISYYYPFFHNFSGHLHVIFFDTFIYFYKFKINNKLLFIIFLLIFVYTCT